MKLYFTKMHGIGNDYVYVNCMQGQPADPNALARLVSPRHFSVGSDGLILICKSDVADVKMRMFNADGSEGKMCGNGIRCVGKYIYDYGLIERSRTSVTIETLSGIKQLFLNVNQKGVVDSVKVCMGKAALQPHEIPVKADSPMIHQPVLVNGETYFLTAVSMGNPHAVCFMDNIDTLNLEKLGPQFEHLSIFPERVNTEFVTIIDQTHLQMRVWERGSGETYACGTGACATVVAAVLNGYCTYGAEVTVDLIGGSLRVIYDKDGTVYMTGPAQKVYDGVYEYEC